MKLWILTLPFVFWRWLSGGLRFLQSPRRYPPRLSVPRGSVRGIFMVHPLGTPAETKHACLARSWIAAFLPNSLLERWRSRLPWQICYQGTPEIQVVPGQAPVRVAVMGVPFHTSAFVPTPAGEKQHPEYHQARAALKSTIKAGLTLHPNAVAIGLGAATSMANKSGMGTQKMFPDQLVTSGNCLTVVTLMEQIRETVLRFYGFPAATIAVVGAGGAIGHSVAAQLAQPEFRNLVSRVILVGSPDYLGNKAPLEEDSRFKSVADLLEAAGISVALTREREVAARHADIIVLVTNEDTMSSLRPEDYRGYQVIIDCNQPVNTPESIRAMPEMLVVSGGRVRIPLHGWPCGKTLGFRWDVVPACFGEFLLHCAGAIEAPAGKHFVGKFDEATISQVRDAFQRSALELVPFYGLDRRPLPADRVVRFGSLVHAHRAANPVSQTII